MTYGEIYKKAIRGLECCTADLIEYHQDHFCVMCPYKSTDPRITYCFNKRDLMRDALSLLKAHEPRVMTLEEVVAHYSLPPVFPDDLGMQFDYLNDIQPLYFDFPHPEDPWIVHWRKYDEVNKYLDGWKADYGKTWRCWTARPTDEQMAVTPWSEPPKEET